MHLSRHMFPRLCTLTINSSLGFSMMLKRSYASACVIVLFGNRGSISFRQKLGCKQTTNIGQGYEIGR